MNTGLTSGKYNLDLFRVNRSGAEPFRKTLTSRSVLTEKPARVPRITDMVTIKTEQERHE